MSVAEKRSCIEPDHSELSVSRQCELINCPVPVITGRYALRTKRKIT